MCVLDCILMSTCYFPATKSFAVRVYFSIDFTSEQAFRTSARQNKSATREITALDLFLFLSRSAPPRSIQASFNNS